VLFAAALPAVSRFRVPPPPRAVIFRIAPPETPAPKPVERTSTDVRKQPTVKRHAARRVPKLALPLKKGLQPSNTEASVAPAPPPPAVESPVQATEVQPVQPETAQATPVESIPQNSPPPQKKRFWNKLNPFRKKKGETALGPSQN
jgi:hypothetical protein